MRCAIYTRKSTSDGLDSDFSSLDAQRDACMEYIKQRAGWQEVPERYDDGGFSGATIDRPAFTRLMRDVDEGRVDVVVVYKLDRLSRSFLDFAKLMERFTLAGASFACVTQPISTADAMGRLNLHVLMSFAEFEREMISERTRDKIGAARRKGKWTGGPVPFGYTSKGKKLHPNGEEAPVVREAFSLFLSHRQMAVVARELNERALLPRRHTRTNARGPLWTKDTIAILLRNPLYAGLIRHREGLFTGEHAALVEQSTFEEAQRLLGPGGQNERVTGTNPDFVLRGLLRCGTCGEVMSPSSTTRRSKVYRFYRCAIRAKFGSARCSARTLPAQPIESFVVERIAEAAQGGSLASRVLDRLTARLEQERTAKREMRVGLTKWIGEGSSSVQALASELSGAGERSRAAVGEKLHVESERLRDAKQRLMTLEREEAELSAVEVDRDWTVETLRNFGSVWEAMTPLNQGRLLRALVFSVRFDEGENRCRVELLDFAEPTLQQAAR